MRLPLTNVEEAARAAALRAYEHKLENIGRLARAANCLPIFVDWTAFLGLGRGGECLWVDYDSPPGRTEPATDLLALSILASRAPLVPGLGGLTLTRLGGRTATSATAVDNLSSALSR